MHARPGTHKSPFFLCSFPQPPCPGQGAGWFSFTLHTLLSLWASCSSSPVQASLPPLLPVLRPSAVIPPMCEQPETKDDAVLRFPHQSHRMIHFSKLQYCRAGRQYINKKILRVVTSDNSGDCFHICISKSFLLIPL